MPPIRILWGKGQAPAIEGSSYGWGRMGGENLCGVLSSVMCSFMRIFERHCVQVLANGHAGQSFRLACLLGKNPGG